MIAWSFQSLDFHTVRRHVEAKLCQIGHLEPSHFPMTQREVVRRGQRCGVYFCLHGPRSVKLTAIADFHSQSMVFYGSDGTRHEKIDLQQLTDA